MAGAVYPDNETGLLGWLKGSLGFPCKTLWKNPSEVFCQLNSTGNVTRMKGRRKEGGKALINIKIAKLPMCCAK